MDISINIVTGGSSSSAGYEDKEFPKLKLGDLNLED